MRKIRLTSGEKVNKPDSQSVDLSRVMRIVRRLLQKSPVKETIFCERAMDLRIVRRLHTPYR